MSVRRRAFRHWPSSLFGVSLAAYDMLHNLPDPGALTWKELGLRVIKCSCIAALGVLGRFGETRESNNKS